MTPTTITTEEVYLNDGLYCTFDGFGITLRAPRPDGDDWVYLEPATLRLLEEYIQQIRKQGDLTDPQGAKTSALGRPNRS
jgi:hypothetical protein